MIIYILKFSACLALFLTFYKLVLEKENMHVFKRFYLLGALLLSIGIPLISFTYYIEPSTEIIPLIAQNNPLQNSAIPLESQINYLSIILWSIYSLGVLFFGFHFIKNLNKLNYKIKHNPKQRSKTITNVLLQDLIVPHTFFNFIFFNKQKFETHQIPKEVFWHEETHAKQKHSIDVLFIEILQIVLWFNPLIYIIKHVIKLNHEFLADQAVLKKGIETTTYQETLLAFSSPDSYRDAKTHQLANAINYSSIKKRFTVMKTQTTKKAIWLRSLVLLPLLAFTLYSFSNKVILEKEKSAKVIVTQTNIPILEISQNPIKFKLNGKSTNLAKLESDFSKVTKGEKSELKIKAKGSVDLNLINSIMESTKENLISIILLDGAYIEDNNSYFKNTQQKATEAQVVEYNKLAKKYNNMSKDNMVIKRSDLERIKYLYDLMSVEQRKKVQPFPSFPAPPPPVPDTPEAPKTNFTPPPPPLPKNATLDWKVLFTKPTKLYKIKAPQKNDRILLVTEEYAKNHPEDVIELSMKDFDFIPLEKEFELINPAPSVLPEDATPEQKKKYKKARENYQQQRELKKVKEIKLNKVIETLNAQVAVRTLKLKAQKGELYKVRELRATEDRKQLREAKLVYRNAQVAARADKLKTQKGELYKVRELRETEDRKQLLEAKLVYKKAQVASRADKLKAQKGELYKVRELRATEDRKQLLEAKLVYRNAQIVAREHKIKAQKEQLVRVKEIHSAEEIAKLKAEKNKFVLQKAQIIDTPKSTWLFINSKGQLLFDDNLATLKTLESKLKEISNNSDLRNVVIIKTEEKTPKEVVQKAEALLKKYNIKIIKE